MSTHNEFKGRGFREAKWPGLIIATQDTELPKGIIEKIKENGKTSYEDMIKKCEGECVKLGKVTKTWCKNGKHRMYVNDLCAVLGIDPKHVKSGEEGRIARELMAAKLWYDVVADEWVSQGIGQARKDQLVAEILKQTGAEEVEQEAVEEPEIIEEPEIPEFTATKPKDSPIAIINRMPETVEEVEALMDAEKITDFKSKVLFLKGCITSKQIHNITFSDVQKYNKLFIEYLTQEKQKEAN